MSTGKRLAKRSILGTRVAAPGGQGLYLTGIIQAVKTCEDPSLANRFSVRFDDNPTNVSEFLEVDLIGPGFKTVTTARLQAGQLVYVTHNQREMSGRVVRHDFDSQDVIITLSDNDETLLKKIDEVRLLESRKSARLINSDTDFSKLADVSLSNSCDDKARKANNALTKSKAIEVPRSDYVQIAGSRKRRTSETLQDEEEVMTECSAAMLLMKLSCSPQYNTSNQYGSSLPIFDSYGKPIYPNLPSPVDSSGASSFRSATPSPPLSSSTGTTDEGIVRDISSSELRNKSNKPKIVYQCTYPGCRTAAVKSVRAIEAHVRREHLNRSDDHPDDGEEEFYYTEVDIPYTAPRARAYTEPASQMANLSLADHLDMARPAHEDPTSTIAAVRGFRNKMRTLSGTASHKPGNSLLISQQGSQASITAPITIAPSVGSPGKYILISPRSESTSVSSSAPSTSSMLKSPGHRRIREGKKCRKVYGLEQRDLWCTQCKWKKACARFGKPAQASQHTNNNSETSSLLIPATSTFAAAATGTTAASSQAIRAIKF